MARTDAVVLGAGIVGVSVALHLAKRGLAVALLDRGDPEMMTGETPFCDPAPYRAERFL
jgi:glycine/D-amino acid oxidase-like deaminating enzyme